MPLTLFGLLDDRCRCNPSGVALEAAGRRPISYQRLLRHCLDTVAFLNRAGVGTGDRVALVLPNGPEMAAAFLAVSMGASCAPLNPLYNC